MTPEKLQILRERAARGESWESTTDADVALLLAEMDALREALDKAWLSVHFRYHPGSVPPEHWREECTERECLSIRALLSEVPQ